MGMRKYTSTIVFAKVFRAAGLIPSEGCRQLEEASLLVAQDALSDSHLRNSPALQDVVTRVHLLQQVSIADTLQSHQRLSEACKAFQGLPGFVHLPHDWSSALVSGLSHATDVAREFVNREGTEAAGAIEPLLTASTVIGWEAVRRLDRPLNKYAKACERWLELISRSRRNWLVPDTQALRLTCNAVDAATRRISDLNGGQIRAA